MFGMAGIVAFIFVLFNTILGPFGTHHALTPIQRLPYVTLNVGLSLVVFYPAFAFTLWLMRHQNRRQVMIALLILASIIAAPCTAINYTVYSRYIVQYSPRVSHDLRLAAVYLANAILLLGAVALMCYVLHLQVVAAAGRRTQSVAPGTQTIAAGNEVIVAEHLDTKERAPSRIDAQSWFWQRLPDRVGYDIIFLKSAGHYIEVVATDGVVRILLRLSDAVRELQDHGMQIHRSYWVAHGHVVGLVRDQDRVRVKLTTGRMLPVSRRYLLVVRKRYSPAQRD